MKKFLFKRVDNSALVLFRIFWGFLLMAEGWGAILTGWVYRVFVEPSFTFTWYGFGWTKVLLGETMYLPYLLLGAMGLFIMLGYKYRLASVLFALIWALVFFMQKTEYNNHYYLLLLICAVMPFMPANASNSIDSKRNPSIHSLSCPNWNILLLPFMMFLVYFYGSIAKMYPDWLQAKPIALWFGSRGDFPIIGPIMTKTWFHYFISYAGIAFDLLIIPMLMIKKLRKWAFIATLLFHLFNSAIFQIGIFPYLGLSFAIFFWPAEKIGKWFLRRKTFYIAPIEPSPFKVSYWKMGLLYAFVVIQVLIPLRHWAIPGDVLWTEEGHRLSWRMMLRSKSGYGDIYLKEGKESNRIKPEDYLTKNQIPMIYTHPDCLHQFIQKVGKQLESSGKSNFSISAKIKISINGGSYYDLIDTSQDLYKVRRNRVVHSSWILNKKESLN